MLTLNNTYGNMFYKICDIIFIGGGKMKDPLFDYLVATDQLDDFLGYKQDNEIDTINNDINEIIDNENNDETDEEDVDEKTT